MALSSLRSDTEGILIGKDLLHFFAQATLVVDLTLKLLNHLAHQQ